MVVNTVIQKSIEVKLFFFLFFYQINFTGVLLHGINTDLPADMYLGYQFFKESHALFISLNVDINVNTKGRCLLNYSNP